MYTYTQYLATIYMQCINQHYNLLLILKVLTPTKYLRKKATIYKIKQISPFTTSTITTIIDTL